MSIEKNGTTNRGMERFEDNFVSLKTFASDARHSVKHREVSEYKAARLAPRYGSKSDRSIKVHSLSQCDS